MIESTPSFWLRETACQLSYPLKSENASPPGTFKAYLSCSAATPKPTRPESAKARTRTTRTIFGCLIFRSSFHTTCLLRKFAAGLLRDHVGSVPVGPVVIAGAQTFLVFAVGGFSAAHGVGEIAGGRE